ncbi:MAG: hypothetical protein KKF44_07285 [Nanoarchaeota archaeon]|nr:hypothetical protein [Nanoarchaeota archaeon]
MCYLLWFTQVADVIAVCVLIYATAAWIGFFNNTSWANGNKFLIDFRCCLLHRLSFGSASNK